MKLREKKNFRRGRQVESEIIRMADDQSDRKTEMKKKKKKKSITTQPLEV